MPFSSKRQQRAAFGGHIPGFSKQKAKEWANETDFSHLPDRAPTEKGKPTLRSKAASKNRQVAYIIRMLNAQLESPGAAKGVVDVGRTHHQRKKTSGLLEAVKAAFALPKPGSTMNPQRVGSYAGQTTTNFLKPPGPAASHAVTNPRMSLSNAMTKMQRV